MVDKVRTDQDQIETNKVVEEQTEEDPYDTSRSTSSTKLVGRPKETNICPLKEPGRR